MAWLQRQYPHALRSANEQIEQDVRERKKAEEALRQSEERFRSAFEHAAIGMALVGTDGRLLQVNRSLCAMLGYSESELLEKTFQELTYPADLQVGAELFRDLWAGRRDHGRLEKRYVHRDGQVIWTVLSAAAVRGSRGAPLYLVSQIQDVTEQVRATQLLEQRVQERTRELSALLRVSRDVVSTLQIKPLVAQTLNRLGEIVPYSAAAIFGLEGQDELVLLGHRGPGSSADLPRRWRVREMEQIQMVLDRREPLVIPDLHAGSPRAISWRESWGDMPGRLLADSASWLGIPLLAKRGVIGLLVLEHRQAGYFTPRYRGLAVAFANQVAGALENARLYAQSQRVGVLEERQRIARELHDSVSQVLYSIGLGAHTARELLDRDPSRAVEPVEHVLSLAEAGLSEMRALIFELRPDALEREGLVSALAKRIEALRARHRLEVAAELGEEPDLSLPVKEALYRVAQEALNNVARHARAGQVTLRLEAGEAKLVLSIEDDGVGFDPQAKHPGHLGLHTMRERMEELGGVLEIESARGHGTVVRATVPIEFRLP